ncbi:MAG: hypothetical protein IJI41_06270 [Anaerolineaceae bacterium]|nr:hypothetical protein [Anaerolineaceae bacterium]
MRKRYKHTGIMNVTIEKAIRTDSRVNTFRKKLLVSLLVLNKINKN